MSEPDPTLQKAIDRAVTSLTRSACTRSRLIDRLIKAGFTREASEGAADEMARLRYLDDRAIGESVVRAVLRKGPAGERLLVQRLRSRGIDRELAAEIARDSLQDVDAQSAANDAARAKTRAMPNGLADEVVLRRVTGFLARRGLAPGVCREAARIALRERSNG